MAYQRKTHDVYVIMQFWSKSIGWEEVAEDDDKVQAKSLLVDYITNEPDIPVMLVRRRVPNEEA